MLNKDLKHRRQRVIMILAHDQKMAIGKDGELLKRHRADMTWFQRMTRNRICIVGRKTYNEVGDLPDRKWLCLTRKPTLDITHQAADIYEAVKAANGLSDTYKMDGTTVIVGGGEIYNAYLESNLIDSIYATVWPDDLKGTTFVTDFRKDPSWIKIEEWPLEENDAVFDSAGLPVPMVEHWIRNKITA